MCHLPMLHTLVGRDPVLPKASSEASSHIGVCLSLSRNLGKISSCSTMRIVHTVLHFWQRAILTTKIAGSNGCHAGWWYLCDKCSCCNRIMMIKAAGASWNHYIDLYYLHSYQKSGISLLLIVSFRITHTQSWRGVLTWHYTCECT